MSRAVTILGMHRSGTSLVTRVLNLIGVWIGAEEDLLEPQFDNPRGFWERRDVYDFHARLLSQLGTAWDTAEPLPPGWHTGRRVAEARGELVRLVKEEFLEHELWGWKDPRTCLTLPLWRAVLDDLDVPLAALLVVRNPLDVCRSLVRRNGFTLEEGYGLWCNYNLAMLESTRGLPRALVSVDKVIEDWKREATRCVELLGLDWPSHGDFEREVDEFVDPSLLHHSSSEEDLVHSDAPAIVVELYRLIREVIDDPELRNAGSFAERLADLRAKYADAARLLAHDLTRREGELHEYEEELNRQRREIERLEGEKAKAADELAEALVRCEELDEIGRRRERRFVSVLEAIGDGGPAEAFNRRLEELEATISDRDELLGEHRRTIAAKDELIQHLDSRLAQLDEQLAERDERLAMLGQQLAARDEQLAEQDERLEAGERRVRELEGKAKHRQADIQRLSAEVDALIQEVDEAAGQRDDALEQLAELTSQLEARAEESRKQRGRLDVMEAELEATRSARDDANSEAESLRTRVMEYQSMVDQILDSRSWRLTEPLRHLAHAMRGLSKRFYRLRSSADRRRSHRAEIQRGYDGGEGDEAEASEGRRLRPRSPRRIELVTAADPKFSLIVTDAASGDLGGCLTPVQKMTRETPCETLLLPGERLPPGRRFGKDGTVFGEGFEVHGASVVGTVADGDFGTGLEAAAASARGRVFVFLDANVRPSPGLIGGLEAALRTHPDTGVVGCRIVSATGLVLDAGRTLTERGTLEPTGVDVDAKAPAYAYVRSVQCPTPAAFAVTRDLLERVGGFDDSYATRAAAVADLACRARSAGYRIVCQPQAEIVARSSAAEAERLRPDDVDRLRAAWERSQALRGAAFLDPEAPSDELTRILVIDAYVVRPDQDSGSFRMFNLLTILRDLGMAVTFVGNNLEYVEPYVSNLQQAGIRVLYWPFVRDIRDHLELEGRRYDHVMICRAPVAAEHIDDVRDCCPEARIVFDTVDLHFLREQRLAELAADNEEGEELARAAARTRELELEVVRKADVTFVVSTAEVELLRGEVPGAEVALVSNIHRVAGDPEPFEGRQDLFFIGGFQHPPNLDAAQYLVRDVLPLAWEQLPGVDLHIVGSKATKDVHALASDHVIVHGYVKDVTPFFARCRVFVAPIRYGAGVKGKVNQAMSHGLPVVASSIATEGMGLVPGEDVLVGDTPEEFAAAVVRLYRDAELWRRLSEAGQRNIEERFSFEVARRALEEVFGEEERVDPGGADRSAVTSVVKRFDQADDATGLGTGPGA